MTVSSGSRFLERYIGRDVQIKPSDFLFNITLTALFSDFVVLCLSEFKTILQVRFACEEKHYLVFFSPIYVFIYFPEERLHSSSRGLKPSELFVSFFPPKRRKILNLKDRLVFVFGF